jgi:hypothetical protein
VVLLDVVAVVGDVAPGTVLVVEVLVVVEVVVVVMVVVGAVCTQH